MNKKSKPVFSFWKALFFALSLILIVFAFAAAFEKWTLPSSEASAEASESSDTRPTVILDAGHGGVDSGAVSVLGDEEKHINLALTKILGEFLEESGVHVIYTRQDDTMLTSPLTDSRKMGDLMGRVTLAKENPEATFISIHMNTLPIEKYKGLQTFYSRNTSGSHVLANLIQNDVRSLLQTDNHRETKDAKGSIYILDRIPGDAVLIECGFLSNYEEAELLKNPEYQKKLAFVLSRSIITYVLQDNNLE